MRTIPRSLVRHGVIHVADDGRGMLTISSEGPSTTTTIGFNHDEARETAYAILREIDRRPAEVREGIRHALMHLDLPQQIDDGIVDYD